MPQQSQETSINSFIRGRQLAMRQLAQQEALINSRLARSQSQESFPLEQRQREAAIANLEAKPDLIAAQSQKQLAAAQEALAKSQVFDLDLGEISDDDLNDLPAVARLAVKSARKRGESSLRLPVNIFGNLATAQTRAGATVESAKIRAAARADLNDALAELARARAASEPQKVANAKAAIAAAFKRLDLQEQQLFAPLLTTLIESFERDELGDVTRTTRQTTQQRRRLNPATGITSGPIDLSEPSGPILFKLTAPQGQTSVRMLTVEQAEALRAKGWKVELQNGK